MAKKKIAGTKNVYELAILIKFSRLLFKAYC